MLNLGFSPQGSCVPVFSHRLCPREYFFSVRHNFLILSTPASSYSCEDDMISKPPFPLASWLCCLNIRHLLWCLWQYSADLHYDMTRFISSNAIVCKYTCWSSSNKSLNKFVIVVRNTFRCLFYVFWFKILVFCNGFRYKGRWYLFWSVSSDNTIQITVS